ncbi:class I SAM-dependent methyltransferase [Acetobacter sp. UBA5411]|uniref:class I SAM-dependent methyltransferase n=1 Tax=Acetobacter sp. UBA5411 TaxID=1945905 RepID=UPI0025BF02BB|nr:class I SAM-dependent methyltransferase [Acetobacter sp. UBA5411]
MVNVSSGSPYRHKRFNIIMTLIDDIVVDRKSCRIVDLGGTPDYWRDFPAFQGRPEITVLVVNLVQYTSDDTRIQCIVGDATSLSSLEDNTFDLVHSNSVIEHVGTLEDMKRMAQEVRRLAPVYYVQAPNYWFPYEFHTCMIGFHWLPKMFRRFLVRQLSCGHYPRARNAAEAQAYVADANSITNRQMRTLFPDAEIKPEKFLGLTKSWMAIRRSSRSDSI